MLVEYYGYSRDEASAPIGTLSVTLSMLAVIVGPLIVGPLQEATGGAGSAGLFLAISCAVAMAVELATTFKYAADAVAE